MTNVAPRDPRQQLPVRDSRPQSRILPRDNLVRAATAAARGSLGGGSLRAAEALYPGDEHTLALLTRPL
jgi:hypothetical protein